MEAGPPGAGCRISPQTTRRCLGISSQVVNGLGKGELDSSGAGQEGERKRTADVLSKDTQPSSKPGRFGSLGQVQQEPVYGLDGDRQIGGASLAQAFMRNMGTWRSDAKGRTQVGGPHEG